VLSKLENVVLAASLRTETGLFRWVDVRGFGPGGEFAVDDLVKKFGKTDH